MSKTFWMPKSAEIDVPRIGSVRVGNGTLGTLKAAVKASKSFKRDEQANAFVNALLAEMCVERAMSSDEIGKLDDEQLRPLASTAMDLLGAAMFADWSEPDTTIRTTAYRAIEALQKDFYERLALPAMKAASRTMDLLRIDTTKLPVAALMSGLDMDRFTGSVFPEFGNFAMPVSTVMADAVGGVVGLSESFKEGMAWNSLSSISMAVEMIGKSSIDLRAWDAATAAVVSASLLGDITSQTAAAAMAFGQFDFGDSLAARTLLSTGIDAPYIHTPYYLEPEPIAIDSVEAGVEAQEQEEKQRRIRCQDVLFELESDLRQFVQQILESEHGLSWWTQRVPLAIRTGCESRQASRERRGEVAFKPIQFAYLRGLKSIIVEKDNWEQSFGVHFQNPTEFEAVMIWISVVRNDVDHARYSANSDYIQFMVAANWIHRRMGLGEIFDMEDGL